MATVDTTHEFNAPPAIDVGRTRAYQMDPQAPLNQLAINRMDNERDLKIIITADDSETGVGKSTLAGFLSMSWTWMFAGNRWTADEYATFNPQKYFELVKQVPPGTVVMIDDAEELDARRSMQDMNVKFSWWWMIMRLRQVFTILTLPSPAAVDSRLEELADVWINVLSRGEALAHDIGVQSYGKRNVTTEKVHSIEFPDISEHEELQRLTELKKEKMEKWEQEMADDGDGDEGLGKVQQTFLATTIKEREDVAWVDVPDHDERLTYSGEFYRQQAKEVLE